MKLLAQFYACLAIIVVFTAVFSGIEARSSNFMAAAGGSHGWVAAEEHSPPKQQNLNDESYVYRVRRSPMSPPKPEEPPKQAEPEEPGKPGKARRHATEKPEVHKQIQAEQGHEHGPEHEHKRNRRQVPQMPPGIPNPEDMAKQMPGGK